MSQQEASHPGRCLQDAPACTPTGRASSASLAVRGLAGVDPLGHPTSRLFVLEGTSCASETSRASRLTRAGAGAAQSTPGAASPEPMSQTSLQGPGQERALPRAAWLAGSAPGSQPRCSALAIPLPVVAESRMGRWQFSALSP